MAGLQLLLMRYDKASGTLHSLPQHLLTPPLLASSLASTLINMSRFRPMRICTLRVALLLPSVAWSATRRTSR